MTKHHGKQLAGVSIVVVGLAMLASVPPAGAAPEPTETVVSFSLDRLALATDGETTRVDYRGAVRAARPGEPDLPTVTVLVEAPAAATVEDVRVEVLRSVSLGVHRIAAATADVRPGERVTGEAPLPPVPDVTAVGHDGFFPDAAARFAARGAMRGHTILFFVVSPLRWNPETGALELLTRLRLSYELVPAPEIALPRRRVVPEIEARFARGLEHVLAAGGSVEVPDSALRDDPEPAGPGPYQPTFRPTTDGSPVEYVVITAEALAAEFEELAQWKTEKGVQAAVRTVEWIDQTYPNGVDRAERVRFFIRDAYQNWGTLFVLLGGDTELIPVRYGISTLLGGESIPADYYYMCLEGNWNGDGDTRFGEAPEDGGPGDDADILPEVYVGRAPVSTVAHAALFVDKTIAYDRAPATGNGYPASILYLAERLFSNIDGATIAEEADAIVPAWFKRVKLYEEYQDWPGALPETYEAVIDSIGNGFGILHHVGHGYRNTMAIGEGVLNNADADALANGDRQSVVFAINCSSASIDFNSIGERFVKNENGGAIAYIGTSRLAFINASRDYQAEWFTSVFAGPDSLRSLGEICALARLPFVPFSGYESSYRWTLFAVTLIGDPEVDLHTQGIAPVTVNHPPAHPLDAGSFAATVSSAGAPLAGATVTLWKGSEAYARGTTAADGAVALAFAPETTGPAILTVNRPGYATYQTTVEVTAAGGPYVHIQSILVDDDSTPPSQGDGDGRADAGETIEIAVTLKNGGTQPATGVAATLAVEDPGGHVTIVSPAVSYGALAAGGSSSGAGRFVVTISPGAPYALQPLFTLAITSGQGAFSDLFVLPVRRSYLEHVSHLIDDTAPRGNGNGIVEADEEIWYSISLRNTGQDTATAVSATLAAVQAGTLNPEPLVTVSDSTSNFGIVRVGSTVTGDRFAFRLDPLLDPSSILLRVTYADAFGSVRREFLDVVRPGTPDSLITFGAPTSVLLKWRRPADPDLLGYDIYRSTNQGGPFVKVNTFLGEGSAVYEDAGLSGLTRYYYRVAARDSSFNSGPLSSVVSASTNPPLTPGWPIEVAQQMSASLQIAAVAGGSDNEVFAAADYQYGWHADGTEIVDGDGDPRTSGVFAPDGYHISKGFSATCVLGDMDRDGTVEVANVGWSVPQAYVWDAAGQLKPGWPQSVLEDFNWPSPLMADLDGDEDLELVVWAAKGGRLFAWHHDGTEVVDGDHNPATNGVLFRVSGTSSFCYSSPAAGNLDADPEPEVVFGLNIATNNAGPIYAVNGDGTLVPGWPVATGDAANPSSITASPAIADLDGDGVNEVIVASERGGGRVHVFRANGTNFPGWPKSVPALTAQVRTGSPVIADIDDDGYLDVVFPSSNGRLWAWNRSGAALPGFPVVFYTAGGEATQSTPTVGDLDADGRMEILIGDESGRLHAFNHDGGSVAGFPIQLNGEVRGSPVIWDIDNDGLIEVAVAGWDASVYIWDLPFAWDPTRIPWPFFRHDAANTGYVGSDVLPVGIPDQGPAAGVGVPRLAVVHPARPNPFNPRTTLSFDVPGAGQIPVSLTIYDVEGRVIRRLLDRRLEAGRHAVDWDGHGAGGQPLAAGVYFYRVAIGDFVASRKLTLVK